MKGTISVISRAEALTFLLPKHYSGRKPQVTVAFGWFFDKQLKAVCTFGKPASNSLCEGVCGKDYSPNVYELNRLCRVDNFNEQLSCFVSACLRRLRTNNWIVVSYSDTDMNHNGYIYQACNFIYTGVTKERTDKYTKDNKHSRHYNEKEQKGFRKIRSAKHRYIYFCSFNKKLKKEWLDKLNYSIQPFPKGENKNYILGTYLQQRIIKNAPDDDNKGENK